MEKIEDFVAALFAQTEGPQFWIVVISTVAAVVLSVAAVA